MALAIGWTTLDLDGLVQISYDWSQEAGIDDFLNSNVLKSSDICHRNLENTKEYKENKNISS